MGYTSDYLSYCSELARQNVNIQEPIKTSLSHLFLFLLIPAITTLAALLLFSLVAFALDTGARPLQKPPLVHTFVFRAEFLSRTLQIPPHDGHTVFNFCYCPVFGHSQDFNLLEK